MSRRGHAAFLLLALAFLLPGCSPPPSDLASHHQELGVSGAGFTTDNIWVDGDSRDICKNSSINCNIYGAKEYVWLNGGPTANRLTPGQYFFAVLVPGGQHDPNDGSAKNLSDDFDSYQDRIFTVGELGEVTAYGGPHDLDSGNFLDPDRKPCKRPHGCDPDGQPPLIRLAPYADTTNPGGVYIMAICTLAGDYPVEPRDCKYDAFKVKEGPMTYDLLLWGIKFEDFYADGVKDDSMTDPPIAGWPIVLSGTGFAGEVIDETIFTEPDGSWQYAKSYTFRRSDPVYTAELTICEEIPPPPPYWHQSFPASICYHRSLEPAALASAGDLDFGNWCPVAITACKEKDLDGDLATGDDRAPVAGWSVSLLADGVVVDTQVTGEDGCYTWDDLEPGFYYSVREQDRAGWKPLGLATVDLGRAGSCQTFQHTFVNTPLQGCTPGFWQGGSDGGQAGGQWLWNEVDDPDWTASGGAGSNPYVWTTLFNDFFTPSSALDGLTMMDLVGTGGGPIDANKAARSLVAGYLDASWGMAYAYTTAELLAMWNAAVISGDYLDLHVLLDAANNAMYRTDGGERCPISASLQ